MIHCKCNQYCSVEHRNLHAHMSSVARVWCLESLDQRSPDVRDSSSNVMTIQNQ